MFLYSKGIFAYLVDSYGERISALKRAESIYFEVHALFLSDHLRLYSFDMLHLCPPFSLFCSVRYLSWSMPGGGGGMPPVVPKCTWAAIPKKGFREGRVANDSRKVLITAPGNSPPTVTRGLIYPL
jgi:hypothetical protein